MRDSNLQLSEFVTDELKQMIGWGATPHRIMKYPHLGEMLGGEIEAPSYFQLGAAVSKKLKNLVMQYDGPTEFRGQTYDHVAMRVAFLKLLGFHAGSAPERRWSVIVLLAQPYTVEEWRRPIGPEREFIGLLAEWLVGQEAELQTS